MYKRRASAAVVCVTILGLLGLAGSAGASSPPAIPGETVLGYTGAEQTYAVPPNVLLVGIDAAGASSGGGNVGASLGGYLPTQGGQTLYAEVGQQGSFGGGATFGGGGAAGAWSCPSICAANSAAGSGGGASDVRTCSATAASCPGGGTSDASRVIVAGGGGGAGGQGESPGFECTEIPQSGRAFNQQNPLPAGNPSQGPVPVATPAGLTPAGLVIPGEPADFGYGGVGLADTTSAMGGSVSPGAGGSLSMCEVLNSDGSIRAAFSPTTAGTSGTGPAGAPGAAVTGTPYGTPEGPSEYLPGAGGGGGGGYTGGGSGAAGFICTTPSGCYDPSPGMSGGGGASFESNQIEAPYIDDGIPAPAGSITIAPIVEIDAPANGATYTPGQVVDASWSCGGGGTPFQGTSCTGTVASGSPIDTSPGTHTFTVTASTHPFNQNVPVSVTYTVGSGPSSLAALPQMVIFGPGASAGVGRVTAMLTGAGGTPLAGQMVAFRAGAHALCTGVTTASGTATCSLGLAKELEVLFGGGYRAAFAGTAGHLAASAAADAIDLGTHAPPPGRHTRQPAATGTLTRAGHVYATVTGRTGHGAGPLQLHPHGAIKAGRYTLALTVASGHGRRLIKRTLSIG